MLPPLRFVPLIKRLRWGGTRLGHSLGKPIGTATDAAESWEVADHGTDQSVVVSGPFAGWTLAQIMSQHPTELLGKHSTQTTFPLLVKFLDAHDRLSLQVHPNDQQARRYTRTEHGKTEAWLILEALPGSLIYAGLKAGTSLSDLQRAVQAGRLLDFVHVFEAHPGDSYLIPAGTVHAVGEGVLLAEIQQTSDITFRLYDWDRAGTDGLPRQLHVREALECVDFTRGPILPLRPRPISGISSNRVEEIVAGEHFVIRRHQGHQPWDVEARDRFRIYVVLEGQVDLITPAGTESLVRGETVLIPADSDKCRMSPQGEATLLETFVPQAAV